MSAVQSQSGVVLPLRQLVPLPHTTINVDVGRDISKQAIEKAQATDDVLYLFTQVTP